eukprot:463763_1
MNDDLKYHIWIITLISYCIVSCHQYSIIIGKSRAVQEDIHNINIAYLDLFQSFSRRYNKLLCIGLLYEMGTRIMQAVSYPKLFGTTGHLLPNDFITSTSDFASIVFELAQIDIVNKYPNYFMTDSTNNWLSDVKDYISDPLSVNINYTQSPPLCCTDRKIDVLWSHARVNKDFKYIFRSLPDYTEKLQYEYPNISDKEQFYDLRSDGMEQINIINNDSVYIRDLLFEFKLDIWNYTRQQSCFAIDKSDCFVPNITYIPTNPTIGIPDTTCCGCLRRSPRCSTDTVCETIVCETVNERCCNRRWTQDCADKAIEICASHDLPVCCNCLIENDNPGCVYKRCENIICPTDPYCCDNEWDSICVFSATAVCIGETIPSCCGCTVVDINPGCSADVICEESVCSQDPFCCDQDTQQ